MFWLGAIASLCYVPGVTGAYIATQWPLLSALLPMVLWRRGPFGWEHATGLLFIAYAVAHMWFTPTPYASVFGLWLVVIMALIVWMGTTATTLRHLYKGLAVGGTVSSAVAVFQFFGFNGLPQNSPDPAGLYVNSVQQGTVLALLAVALVSEKLWLWTLPLLPGLVLSHSAGAAAALAAGLIAIRFRKRWLVLVAVVAVVVWLGVSSRPSDAQRMLIWGTAWQNLTLYGWGPGVFYTILIPQNGGTFFPEHAHNDALQLLFEYGAGALLPLAVFAVALRRTSCTEWPVVVAFVTAGFYSMPLYMPLTALIALTAVGRVLRRDAVVIDNGSGGGQHVISWRRSEDGAGWDPVSVAPGNPGKG